MKMTILYLKDSGHAMAACTRATVGDEVAAADSDQSKDTVLALAGEALLVRGFRGQPGDTPNATQFAIPAEELAALTLERDDDQLLTPRAYSVSEENRLQVPAAGDAPAPVTKGTDTSILYVDLVADVLVERHILLHVVPLAGAAGKARFCHEIYKPGSATAHEVSFGMGEPLKGDYDVLMLVAGLRPAVRRLTVP